MGSLITFGVDKFELDWAKNSLGRDYRTLFQTNDLGEASYYYAEDVVETKPAYVRPLSLVPQRLDLLGYSLAYCRSHLEEVLREVDSPPEGHIVDVLIDTLSKISPKRFRLPEGDDYDFGEFASEAILADRQFSSRFSVSRHVGLMFENIDPLVLLRVLCTNKRNRASKITWRFHDVLVGGWVSEESLRPELSPANKFLIVTEGSTDSYIIARAISYFRPDVADFFSFVDMKEHYPFTGTGSLQNFIKGLAKIGVLNRILCIFDNDAEGRSQLRRLASVSLPPNISAISLPDLSPSRKFLTLGPAGAGRESVNGKAVSIEMFLDLSGSSKPTIRWTNFVEELGCYQGHLIGKDEYVRTFKKHAFKSPEYNLSELETLVEFIIQQCTTIASRFSPS